MLLKVSIGLLALGSVFGLSKPAKAQGYYWGIYGVGYGPSYQYGPAYTAYHPSDTIPYFPPYYFSPYYTPYYVGYPNDWWWISWGR